MSNSSTAAVVVGTRLHWTNHAQDQRIQVETALLQVLTFCARAATYADGILIAVGLPFALSPASSASIEESEFVASVREFLSRLQRETRDGVTVPSSVDTTGDAHRVVRVEIIPMLHWGSFVPALNAIISTAATRFQAASLLILQSLEIQVDAASVHFLQTHFEVGEDLVVGAALPGHNFQPNSDSEPSALLELNGLTTPWNTLALWDLARLALIGFPLIGDGLKVDDTCSCAGVEEVSTIALYQQLFPLSSRAKVVNVPGISWQVENFESDERRAWQERKMASKLQRAERQMAHFKLANRGKVLHLQQ